MRTLQGMTAVNSLLTALVVLHNDFCFPHLITFRTSGPSVAGLETTYSGGNGFSTSYNSQRWLNLYLSACKFLDLALALPPESLPQFQMSVQINWGHSRLGDKHSVSGLQIWMSHGILSVFSFQVPLGLHSWGVGWFRVGGETSGDTSERV